MKEKGFSLIELLITVSIISVLASIALAQFNEYTRRAHDKEAISTARNILSAASRYYTDHVQEDSEADKFRTAVNDMYHDAFNLTCNKVNTATLCQHNDLNIRAYDGSTSFTNDGIAFKIYHSKGATTYCVSPDFDVLPLAGVNTTCP